MMMKTFIEMAMPNSESTTNNTLVIGAGELGTAVIKALYERNATVEGALSVLLRPKTNGVMDPQAKRFQAMGVSIVRADLATETRDKLTDIFAEYTTVICCTGFVGGPGTQRKITAAVLNAGVKRYVPWQFGVDYDIVGHGSGQEVFDEQSDVRDMLRAQCITRWIIVTTGMFTTFLFEPSFGVVDLENARVHALGSWDNRLTVTTPEDIGHLTAAILAHQPSLDDRVVYVAGDTFSYAELADMVDHHLGRSADRILWSMDTLRSEAAAHPKDGMRKYHLAFARDTGVAWDKTTTFNAEQQISVTDVPNWLTQRKSME